VGLTPYHPSARPAVPGGVLAIDAGGTKTDVALVAADGTVLGAVRGGGFHPQESGAAAAVAGLAPLVAGAARQAGLGAHDGPLAEHVSACLANADFPVEERMLHAALTGYGWGRELHVTNDTFAVLRAGVEEPLGVAVVCGTGINCVGMLPDGRTARFPAVGRISGDWGGGGFLAEEALWWAARAEDGRGEPTALATAVPELFGLPTMYAVIEALHLDGSARAAERRALSPLLFRVAEEGDAVARRVVRRQAEEIVSMAAVALERLGLLDAPAPVVLGGGVVAARHPLLTEGVTAGLALAAPKAVPRIVTAPPVLGAVLLGLDRTGAPPAAQSAVRGHYGYPAP
jgi:N-acetylglucosamine kinase-like BadF-type ATPase